MMLNLTKHTPISKNAAEIEELESTVQALENSLQYLDHRSAYVHRKVESMLWQQQASIRVLKKSNRFHQDGRGSNLQSPQELLQGTAAGATMRTTDTAPPSMTRSASLCRRNASHRPYDHQQRLQDVAVLDSILPNVEDRQARLLLLALKLEIEREDVNKKGLQSKNCGSCSCQNSRPSSHRTSLGRRSHALHVCEEEDGEEPF